jgi:lysophospholipase L1-like esterase
MRLTRLRAAIVAIALVASLPGVAAAEQPSETVYLSLGTSLAAGSQIDAEGSTTASSDWSYPDQLYQRIKGRLSPSLVHEKLGCAGETTDTIRGGLTPSGRGSNCIYESGSQLDEALSIIAEGNVALITIDLGANDILDTQLACGGDPTCIAQQIPTIAGKVGAVVGELREAGYGGPILAMNYYNPQVAAAIGFFAGITGPLSPSLALAVGSDQLLQAFNAALGFFYAQEGAEVVDVYAAFNSGDFGDDQPLNGIPDNVDAVCALSYMCPSDPEVKANIHLNRKGYKVIAKTFLEAVVGLEPAA